MRNGFTTGSCAAAAARAAAYMLFTGQTLERIRITTPSGEIYQPDIECIRHEDSSCSCMVKKDSGDDPDITNGMLIGAKVCLRQCLEGEPDIIIEGGEGIGTVTREGLCVPVGEAAINPTPLRMIEDNLREVCELCGYGEGLEVIIFAPEGRKTALRTFNGHMGIEGGISILGTTGIVEPMSSKALADTIRLDISMQKAEGRKVAVLVPGNYGVSFLKGYCGLDDRRIVLTSNFIGLSLEEAVSQGFEKILFCSHIGKLIKVSGGITDTHSSNADCRRELFLAAYVQAVLEAGMQPDTEVLAGILAGVSTTAALDAVKDTGYMQKICDIILQKALRVMRARLGEKTVLECIMYDNVYGVLAKSVGADDMIKEAGFEGES